MTIKTSDLLSRVRIVLLRPQHPGNIGAAARAMKTMGLSDLALVAPEKFPHAQADAMATDAKDVLDGARVFPDLNAAVSDCARVAGTSSRLRALPRAPHEAAFIALCCAVCRARCRAPRRS